MVTVVELITLEFYLYDGSQNFCCLPGCYSSSSSSLSSSSSSLGMNIYVDLWIVHDEIVFDEAYHGQLTNIKERDRGVGRRDI